MSTLFAFVNSIPELTGRVFMDTAPGTPGTPYALVWEKPGGISTPFHGVSGLMGVNPCVTVYARPASGENAAQARVRAMHLLTLVQSAPALVQLDSDGVTPFTPGSFQLTGEVRPRPDSTAPGQYYATAQFTALVYRTP